MKKLEEALNNQAPTGQELLGVPRILPLQGARAKARYWQDCQPSGVNPVVNAGQEVVNKFSQQYLSSHVRLLTCLSRAHQGLERCFLRLVAQPARTGAIISTLEPVNQYLFRFTCRATGCSIKNLPTQVVEAGSGYASRNVQ